MLSFTRIVSALELIFTTIQISRSRSYMHSKPCSLGCGWYSMFSKNTFEVNRRLNYMKTRQKNNNSVSGSTLKSLKGERCSPLDVVTGIGREFSFRCGQCRKDCHAIPCEFAYGLACESCVRNFYRGAPKIAIAEELRCRAFGASRLVAMLEKRRRKSKALSDTHSCDLCGGGHTSENCRLA